MKTQQPLKLSPEEVERVVKQASKQTRTKANYLYLAVLEKLARDEKL